MENNENLTNEVENQSSGTTIRELFLILKRHFILILATIVVFTAVGIGYANLKKPEYTVTNKLTYRCENVPFVNGNGDVVNPNTTTSNINTMIAYGETIMDLFDKGVVLDRANYYYKEYSNAKLQNKLSVEEFLTTLETNDNYSPSQENTSLSAISSSKIGMKQLSNNEETKFAFNVSYTDPDSSVAQDKLAILIYAFSKECKSVTDDGAVKYFGQFEVFLSDMGVESITNNVSKTKTMVIFFILGVVVAVLLAGVVSLLDNTVKTKEELEKLIGAPVFSAVDNVG